jgi:alkyl sulfatase BDS1-like metallo-beta-lactamase superfamily hydrolase
MLSLKTLFDAHAAGDLDATIALHIGNERFGIRIVDGEITIARIEVDTPNAILDTDQETLLSLLRTDRPVDDALDSGQLRLSGDRALVDRFLNLFPASEQRPVARA